MNDLMNDIEINNVDYKYKIVHINNLPNFLAIYKLINSFELIIKEHKNDYTIQKLIEDSKKIKKDTKFFILLKNNLVIHIERFVYAQNSKSMYLDFIHTHSDYRKKGIGNACLFYLLKRTQNYFKVYELKVRKDNISAINLYIKNNFKIISTIIQKSNNENIEVLIMKLVIKNNKFNKNNK